MLPSLSRKRSGVDARRVSVKPSRGTILPWAPSCTVDVTDSVVKGADTTTIYEGLYQGMPYVPQPSGSGQGFGALLEMKSWLVISK
jgi:hypothetical protein